MEFLIFLAVLAAAWFLAKDKVLKALKDARPPAASTKPPSASEPPVKTQFVVTRGPTTQQPDVVIDTGALRAAGEGEWVLNPKAPLFLTLVGSTKTVAQEVQAALKLNQFGAHKAHELTLLVACHNLRFKEVDAFLEALRPRYEEQLSRFKASHPEWTSASEKDREDLLTQFEVQLRSSLGIDIGQADLIELLKGPSAAFEVDDALLKQFGNHLDLYPFYLSQLGRVSKVATVKADDWSRPQWERLVELGKALRGKDILRADVLESMKLKELNDLLQGVLEKPATRKAKAIEAALALPDIDARLEKVLAFRELFTVVPPDGVPLEQLQASFRYANQLALVVQQTYVTGVSTLETLQERKQDADIYDAWEVMNWKQPHPQCAQAFCKKTARKPSQLPPFHVGCTCFLQNAVRDD